MSHSKLRTRILAVAAVGLVAAGLPSIVANADDVSWLAFGDSATSGESFSAPPVLPGGGLDAVQRPDVILPQIDTSAVPVRPGENPFQQQVAVIVPTVTPSAPALSGANPFAPLPTVSASAAVVPSAKPFALGGPQPIGGTAEAPAPDATKTVDETALRYYAAERDLPRVGAETRRLKALYPDWEPPADLFIPVSTVNEQPLWDLFGSGQYAAERDKIAETKAANPNWVPSADLITKLEDAEAAQGIRQAYAAGNWAQVVAIAQARNSVLVCSQIESMWQVGEALAGMRSYAASFDLYKYILLHCGNADERLSTVQKAARVLPQQGVWGLVQLGRPLPDGTTEFASVGFDDLRHRIGAAISDEFEAGAIDPAELERFAAYVRATRLPDDIGLIGWYYYSQEQWDAARAWFAAGSRLSKDPKFLEGQVLSLRQGGETDAALKLATAVKLRSPELRKEYIELVAAILTDPESDVRFSTAEMKSFQQIVTSAKSALGAQAIGWTYIADNELSTASDWFDDSMKWEVTEGGVIGQAVIASRLKQYKTLSSLKAKYTDDYRGLEKFKVYTVKAKRSSGGSSKVTQARVECKDRKGLGLFLLLTCRS